MGRWATELRLGLRGLVRRPATTSLSIAALGLGIGGTIAFVTSAAALWLSPLPYAQADRLVVIGEAAANGIATPTSMLTLADWREQTVAFSAIGGARSQTFLVGGGSAEPAVEAVGQVTTEFLEALGVVPQAGRRFAASELDTGAHVALVSETFVTEILGEMVHAIGASITLNEVSYEVVGVLPAGFEVPVGGRVPRLWVPIDPATYGGSRGARALFAVGRLGPDSTIDSAAEVLRVITSRLVAEHPESMAGRSPTIASLHETLRGTSRMPLTLLGGAALLFLLAACSNVAGLQLEQHERRRRDLGVRLALGANSRDLLRQFLAESVWLCLGGCIAALAIAAAALHWLPAILELMGGRPPVLEMGSAVPRLGRTTIGSMASIGIFVAATLALLPALALRRRDALELLRSRAFGRSGHYRRVLVVAQVAISVVLLLGNGLLLRSFVNLTAEDPGFSIGAVTRFGLGIPEARYAEESDQIDLHRRLAARLARLPGMRDVGLIARLPLGNGPAFATRFEVVGGDAAPEPLRTRINIASAGFFRALEVPLLRGRLVDWSDGPDAARALVVSESFAAAYLPQQPLGERLRVGFRSGINPPGTEWEVVGVVGDLRQVALGVPAEPTVYLPASQFPLDGGSYVLRGSAEGPTHAAAVRGAVWEIDPELQEVRVVTMRSRLRDSLAEPRTAVAFATGFGSLAILLTSLGVYGAIAAETARRRREIAIRQALGARASQVFAMVLRSGLALSLAGTLTGLPVAWWSADLLRSRLHGVAPSDLVTVIGVASLVAGLTALACAAPALRALRVAPMETIRES